MIPPASLQNVAAALNQLMENFQETDVKVAAAMEEKEAQWLLQEQQLQQQVQALNRELEVSIACTGAIDTGAAISRQTVV